MTLKKDCGDSELSPMPPHDRIIHLRNRISETYSYVAAELCRRHVGASRPQISRRAFRRFVAKGDDGRLRARAQPWALRRSPGK